MKVKGHVRYKIQPQQDGSCVILMKDKGNGRLTIVSHHDTLQEAEDELTTMEQRPSQAETITFFKELKDSIDRA